MTAFSLMPPVSQEFAGGQGQESQQTKEINLFTVLSNNLLFTQTFLNRRPLSQKLRGSVSKDITPHKCGFKANTIRKSLHLEQQYGKVDQT